MPPEKIIKIRSSENGQKCYNIMVTGKVLDAGFRTLIEDIARFHDLRGYAFNDLDGSVKMVCCGDDAVINEFLDEVQGSQKRAAIEDIEKEQITQKIFLPQKFSRLYTDEFADISRKLDVGVEVLKDIKGDTSALVIEMREHNREQRDFNNEMREYNQWMKEHLSKMDEHNKEQRDHNKRLEKILEKIAEK